MSSSVQLSVVILEGQSHTSRLIVDSAIISVHLELRGNHSLFYQSEWGTVSTCSVPQWYFRSDFSQLAINAERLGGKKVNCTSMPISKNPDVFQVQTLSNSLTFCYLHWLFLAFSILTVNGFWWRLWRAMEFKQRCLPQPEENKHQHQSNPNKSGLLGLDMQQGIFCGIHERGN